MSKSFRDFNDVMTFRELRLVARWRLRNEWQRWRHRGSGRDYDAVTLQQHCRTRPARCRWCGRGV